VSSPELELADWRRQVAALYGSVRGEPDPERAHALWRTGRDELFRSHPQSPLPVNDPLRETGLPYWPYEPSLRLELELELELEPAAQPQRLLLATGGDGTTALTQVGRLVLPPPLDTTLAVWWLEQYGGGIFLPLRDGSAGQTSYGGGRYALDTAKGADLGGTRHSLVIDLNFLYHPSCRYDSRWVCPLAPRDNVVAAEIHAGERL